MVEPQNQRSCDSKHSASYQQPSNWMNSGEENEQYANGEDEPDRAGGGNRVHAVQLRYHLQVFSQHSSDPNGYSGCKQGCRWLLAYKRIRINRLESS